MSVDAAAEPLSIGIEFSIVSGVAAAFQATSQRTPTLTVKLLPTRQVSPAQIAQVGPGTSSVQSPLL